MRFQVVTIFPEFFTSPMSHGVVARAFQSGLAAFETVDLRSFTHDRHRTVDDRPFGGGEGMVFKPEPMAAALESLSLTPREQRLPRTTGASPETNAPRESVILLSAQGRPFTQAVARELATLDRVVLLCGRYEGVDERINDLFCDRELSIGDYVLSGGELAAAVLIDAVVRLLPGVLGHADSSHFESFGEHGLGVGDGNAPASTAAARGLLDYPQYTRPAEFRGLAVPEPLIGGNHVQIRRWRRRAALAKTMRNRPDLLERATLDATDRKLIEELQAEAERAEWPAE
jgi:tRNA (guanine37-N1)-methyltransferase